MHTTSPCVESIHSLVSCTLDDIQSYRKKLTEENRGVIVSLEAEFERFMRIESQMRDDADLAHTESLASLDRTVTVMRMQWDDTLSTAATVDGANNFHKPVYSEGLGVKLDLSAKSEEIKSKILENTERLRIIGNSVDRACKQRVIEFNDIICRMTDELEAKIFKMLCESREMSRATLSKNIEESLPSRTSPFIGSRAHIKWVSTRPEVPDCEIPKTLQSFNRVARDFESILEVTVNSGHIFGEEHTLNQNGNGVSISTDALSIPTEQLPGYLFLLEAELESVELTKRVEIEGAVYGELAAERKKRDIRGKISAVKGCIISAREKKKTETNRLIEEDSILRNRNAILSKKYHSCIMNYRKLHEQSRCFHRIDEMNLKKPRDGNRLKIQKILTEVRVAFKFIHTVILEHHYNEESEHPFGCFESSLDEDTLGNVDDTSLGGVKSTAKSFAISGTIGDLSVHKNSPSIFPSSKIHKVVDLINRECPFLFNEHGNPLSRQRELVKNTDEGTKIPNREIVNGYPPNGISGEDKNESVEDNTKHVMMALGLDNISHLEELVACFYPGQEVDDENLLVEGCDTMRVIIRFTHARGGATDNEGTNGSDEDEQLEIENPMKRKQQAALLRKRLKERESYKANCAIQKESELWKNRGFAVPETVSKAANYLLRFLKQEIRLLERRRGANSVIINLK